MFIIEARRGRLPDAIREGVGLTQKLVYALGLHANDRCSITKHEKNHEGWVTR